MRAGMHRRQLPLAARVALACHGIMAMLSRNAIASAATDVGTIVETPWRCNTISRMPMPTTCHPHGAALALARQHHGNAAPISWLYHAIDVNCGGIHNATGKATSRHSHANNIATTVWHHACTMVTPCHRYANCLATQCPHRANLMAGACRQHDARLASPWS